MSDTLTVPVDRGIIRFLPIQEENIATNGRTVLSEIEKLEKQQSEETSAMKRALAKGSRRSLILRRAKSLEHDLARKASTKTLATSTPSAPNGHKSPTPPPPPPPFQGLGQHSRYPEPEPFDTSSTGLLINGRGDVVDSMRRISPPEKSPVDSKMGSPKDYSAINHADLDRRPSSRSKQLPLTPKDIPHLPPPPPIPVDDDKTEKAKKLSKRRSLISIFSRKG